MWNVNFIPRFIFPSEYKKFRLPDSSCNPDIDELVCLASQMIDSHCGRIDGDGSGSLVYTTYMERITSQSIRRNIFYLPKRPLVALTENVVMQLAASGAASTPGDFVSGNFYDTGAIPSSTILIGGGLSAVVGASGRYTYGRRDNYAANDAYQQFLAPMALSTLAGGPANWQPLDITNLDYDPQTGEAWLATGSSILGYNYNEVIVVYNSGFDPRNLPWPLKQVCAALVRNMMAMGSGTTGMRSFSSSKSGLNAEFDPNLIDPNLQRMLEAYVSVRVY